MLVHAPDNLLGATLQNLQCKFYAVGMMYSINARVSFQQQLTDQRTGVRYQIHELMK